MTAPIIEQNAFTVNKGGLVFIDPSHLWFSDPAVNDVPVLRIDSLPTQGQLLIQGVDPVEIGSMISRREIENMEIWYSHTDTGEDPVAEDSFDFTVTDGVYETASSCSIAVNDNGGWLLVLHSIHYAPFLGGWFTSELDCYYQQRAWEAWHAGLVYRLSQPVDADFSMVLPKDNVNIINLVLAHPVDQIDGAAATVMASKLKTALIDRQDIRDLIILHGPRLEDNLHLMTNEQVGYWEKCKAAIELRGRRPVVQLIWDWLGVLSFLQREYQGIR